MSMMRWSTQSGNAEADIYLQEMSPVPTPGNILGKDDESPKLSHDRRAPIVRFCYRILFIALSCDLPV
jgi:hypothetical protein